MGCFKIYMGLQSGDEHIRKVVMNRKISMREVVNAVDICKEHRIKTTIDIIFGVPAETRQQMVKTLDTLAKLDIDEAKSHIFYPYPYTKLEQLSKKMGLLGKDSFKEDYHSGTVLNYSRMHKSTVLFMHLYANKIVQIMKKIYKRETIIKKILIPLFKYIIFNNIFIFTTIISRNFVIKSRSLHRKRLGIQEFDFIELKDDKTSI